MAGWQSSAATTTPQGRVMAAKTKTKAKARVIPELEFHPLADEFDVLSVAEFEALKSDIEANGLLQPLVLSEGLLLDGRHRYLACKELGILPDTRPLPAGVDAASYVVATNLLRRHLSASQRAIIAVKIEGYKHGGVRQQTKGQTSLEGLASRTYTRAEVAKIAQVSETTLADAKKVNEKCIPEIVAAVKSDEIKVKEAAAVAEKPEAVQKAALELYQRGDRQLPTIAKAARAVEIEEAKSEAIETAKTFSHSELCQIHTRGVAEMAELIEAGSVDAIITDPPYEKEGIQLYKPLAELAAHALRPGGYLLVMTGGTSVPEWLAEMAHPRLKFNYGCHISLEGSNQKLFYRRVYQRHKYVWWYVADEHTSTAMHQSSFYSALTEEERLASSYHKWGQQIGIMDAIVSEFCQPTEIVLDPFLGSGTTGISALKHGCRFIGSDIDEVAVDVAKGRLAECLEMLAGQADAGEANG